MGAGEARQRRLLHPRALRLRRHGALASTTARTDAWATGLTPTSCRSVRGHVVDRGRRSSTRTRSTNPGNTQINQKHWIGVRSDGGRALPRRRVRRRAWRRSTHGTRRWRRARTTATAASGPATAACSTPAAAAGRTGKGEFAIFSLDTAIQAVGEGNYGRLGAGQQQRYTDADAETSSPSRPPANTPDEQPGAMPEIFPSAPAGDRRGHAAEHRPLLDLPVDVHAGLGQLRHRVAGRAPAARRAAAPRPRLARGRAAGPGRAAAASQGRDIRLGRGSVGRARLARDGKRYTTVTDSSGRACARPTASATRCRAAPPWLPSSWTASRRRTMDARDQPRPRSVDRGRPRRAPHARRDRRVVNADRGRRRMRRPRKFGLGVHDLAVHLAALLAGRVGDRVRQRQAEQRVEQLVEVRAPADGDGGDRHAALEDQVPADDPGRQLAERGVVVGVGAAGHRDGGGQLREGRRREHAGHAGEDEGEHDRRPRGRDRLADDHEDAGADDRAEPSAVRPRAPTARLTWVVLLLRLLDEGVDRLGGEEVGGCVPWSRLRRARRRVADDEDGAARAADQSTGTLPSTRRATRRLLEAPHTIRSASFSSA